MIHIVGAGSGAEDLITIRGARYLESADVVIYAGSLVNPALLKMCSAECTIYDSAAMSLEEVMDVMISSDRKGLNVVRLHTGDPSIYGAIKEQIDILKKEGISFDICPGVSSMSGAAASLNIEYTLPGISQSVIITRVEGRTPVPEKESIHKLAEHDSTMVLFLSSGMAEKVSEELLKGGRDKDTPVAVVYKASWPEEKIIHTTIDRLVQDMKENGINKTALIIVGEVTSDVTYDRSKLYDPSFTTEYRQGKEE